jgi:hypothetical protein
MTTLRVDPAAYTPITKAPPKPRYTEPELVPPTPIQPLPRDPDRREWRKYHREYRRAANPKVKRVPLRGIRYATPEDAKEAKRLYQAAYQKRWIRKKRKGGRPVEIPAGQRMMRKSRSPSKTTLQDILQRI